MTRAQTAKNLAKNILLYVGLAVVVVAAIPLLASLAWGVRLLIPLLVLVGIVLLSFNLRGPLVAVSTVTGDLKTALGITSEEDDLSLAPPDDVPEVPPMPTEKVAPSVR